LRRRSRSIGRQSRNGDAAAACAPDGVVSWLYPAGLAMDRQQWWPSSRRRDRKKKATGKCGGRLSHLEKRPAVVALAKSLARKKPKGGRLSLRAISAELEAQGHLNERGNLFNPKSIASMLGRIAL
jgi:hypothetical protein